MKFVTYEIAGRQSFGLLTADGVIDVPANLPDAPGTLAELVGLGHAGLEKVALLQESDCELCDLSEAKMLAPIPRPGKTLGLAVNYVEHHYDWERREEMPDHPAKTTTPRVFMMPPTVIAATGDQIEYPLYSDEVDYECELVVVIGKQCKNVTPQNARQYIAGYTIGNDISARSCTHAVGRIERGAKDGFFDWLHGKWADGFLPTGPAFVTADEVGDPHNLKIKCFVNGELRQDASTAQMIFSVDEMVAFCSKIMTLEPGDIIATGTPAGVGKATGNYLNPGDEVTCCIEKLGELVNIIGQKPAEFYKPCEIAD